MTFNPTLFDDEMAGLHKEPPEDEAPSVSNALLSPWRFVARRKMNRPFAIWNGLESKYLLADSGNVFLTDKRDVADGVIQKLSDDGADVSRLEIVPWFGKTTSV